MIPKLFRHKILNAIIVFKSWWKKKEKKFFFWRVDNFKFTGDKNLLDEENENIKEGVEGNK